MATSPMSSLLCATNTGIGRPPASPRRGYDMSRNPSGFGDNYSVDASFPGSTMDSSVRTRTREYECDYDSGATDLYKRIEGKDWDGAIARTEVCPQEAKTWVSRKEHGTNKTRWRLLPLHATCIFRSPLQLIEALIKAYPDGPTMKDDQGMLPIHLACRNGASKGVVLTLLDAYPESIRVRDRKGRIPLALVEASSSQNKESVINAMSRFEQEEAASIQKRESLSLSPTKSFVAVEPNEVDYEHRTILFRLVLKKDWDAVATRARSNPTEAATFIVTKGFNGNLRFLPLHKACVLQPSIIAVEALVAAYPDGAKSKDQDGWLPLHCACFYGASEDVIKALMAADPKGAHAKDDEGRLPLHYACLKGASQDIVDLLLSNFPKGSMSKDDEGRLPIHHACSKGAPEGVIDALLKATPKGAQSKDDQGRLPLHHACRKNASERVIRTLLRVYPRAAQVKDDQDKLPIHYACQNGASTTVVNILLTTYPESINVKNGFGYTPLAEAKAMENNAKMEPIIQLLEKFKADQDRQKAELDGDNSIGALEAKNAILQSRIVALEGALSTVANLGKDLKLNMKKEKDTYVLLSKFADKLSNIDVGIEASPAIPNPSRPKTPKRGLASPLRSFGRSKRSPSPTTK